MVWCKYIEYLIIFDLNESKSVIDNYKTIYTIYTGTVQNAEIKNYKLYLWIDEDVTDSNTMNKAFTASLAAKVK